jgi:hypothetical protein
MRNLLLLFIPVTFLFMFMAACDGDYRQRAIGENHEIIVVMDSALHESETADALRNTFGKIIETLPGQGENLYTLRFMDFQTNDELDQIRKFKNIIFAGPIDDETNTERSIVEIVQVGEDEGLRVAVTHERDARQVAHGADVLAEHAGHRRRGPQAVAGNLMINILGFCSRGIQYDKR